MRVERATRILLAKPGLDGHDRGIKVVGMALRDAGFDVIYLGLRQSPESIMAAAIEEDVDAIGVSILSGVHLAISQQLLDLRAAQGNEGVPIFVGGTIPDKDRRHLLELGIAGVFPVGTDVDDVVFQIQRLMDNQRISYD